MNKSPLEETSLSSNVAAGSELAQAVGTAQNVATTTDDLPMAGFGAGVHQYLNQLLAVTYSKTTTLLAANVVIISLLLSTRSTIKIGLEVFYIGAVCLFSLSAIISTIVLFPRLHHHDAQGMIFWRAILLHGSPDAYYNKVQKLSKSGVEEQYARDNFQMARTLGYKDILLRCAIMIYILGMACAVIGVVAPTMLSHH